MELTNKAILQKAIEDQNDPYYFDDTEIANEYIEGPLWSGIVGGRQWGNDVLAVYKVGNETLGILWYQYIGDSEGEHEAKVVNVYEVISYKVLRGSQ